MLYYHVAENGWDGDDLTSLVSQYGESEAIELFCERWPEAENSAYEHSSRIHLHSTLDEAKKYWSVDKTGDILAIELDEDAESECCIVIDELEYPHPVACEDIPAEYISVVKPN